MAVVVVVSAEEDAAFGVDSRYSAHHKLMMRKLNGIGAMCNI
jgi:hypothetical protein